MGNYLIAIFYLIPNVTDVREYKIAETEIIRNIRNSLIIKNINHEHRRN